MAGENRRYGSRFSDSLLGITVLGVALGACVQAGPESSQSHASLAMLQSGPPPIVTLSNSSMGEPGDVVPLEAHVFDRVGDVSGARVTFVATAGGIGSGVCPPVLSGSCLGIVGSPRVLGAETTDVNGIATLLFTIPAQAPPSIYLQAVVRQPSSAALSPPTELGVMTLAGVGESCAADPDSCETGLNCCYPCGIPGCENVCTMPCDPSEIWCAGGCPLYP